MGKHLVIFWYNQHGVKVDTWQTTNWTATMVLCYDLLVKEPDWHFRVYMGL